MPNPVRLPDDDTEYSTGKFVCPKCGRPTPHPDLKDCPATPPA